MTDDEKELLGIIGDSRSRSLVNIISKVMFEEGMKDTNKMPDEIYACEKSQEWGDFDQYGEDDVCYIKKDLYTALQERNARLVEALEFYANSENWKHIECIGVQKAKQAIKDCESNLVERSDIENKE